MISHSAFIISLGSDRRNQCLLVLEMFCPYKLEPVQVQKSSRLLFLSHAPPSSLRRNFIHAKKTTKKKATWQSEGGGRAVPLARCKSAVWLGRREERGKSRGREECVRLESVASCLTLAAGEFGPGACSGFWWGSRCIQPINRAPWLRPSLSPHGKTNTFT